jgi:hypothetical protein
MLPALSAQQLPRRVDPNFNSWFMYFGDHPVSDKWQVHLEGQWRRHDFASKWQQLLLRPAINYKVHNDVLLTAGYGFIRSYPYGDFPSREATPEHRIYQQLQLTHRAGKFGFLHRYRLEQRWNGLAQPDGRQGPRQFRYGNRFRYMFRAQVPVSEKYFIALYDEILVGFGRNAPVSPFDQNRAYAAVGKHLGKATRVEVGYLNQTLIQRSGAVRENNHTFQLAIFSAIPFGRK